MLRFAQHDSNIVLLTTAGRKNLVSRSKIISIHTQPEMRKYYVYIMTNHSKTLYTGVTNNLERRVQEHKQEKVKGFTAKYKIKNLVYFEEGNNIQEALRREKEIKGWLRKKKIALIESVNPEWNDLSKEWYEVL